MDANYCAKSGLLMRLRVAGGDCSCLKPQSYFTTLKLYHLDESQNQETLNNQENFYWDHRISFLDQIKKKESPTSLA